ncbi:beta-carotene 15,15'-dioxygenase-domain-containing protein [Zopfochytrium polystomum]|nr:beta-carotene 15,15'-dioxygenase-domain-containing protein [Zopfochytrium polystomum]
MDRLAGPLLLLSVGGLGIPHGAVDHIVYYTTCLRRAVSAITSGTASPTRSPYQSDRPPPAHGRRPWTKLRFYFAYAGTLSVYLAMWKLYPSLAFWCFMVASALHFGQDDLAYLKHHNGGGGGPRDPLRLYLSRGVFLLACVLTSNTAVTGPVVAKLLGIDENDPRADAATDSLPYLGARTDPAAAAGVAAVAVVQHAIVLLWEASLAVASAASRARRRYRRQTACATGAAHVSVAATAAWSTASVWLLEFAKAALLSVLVVTVDPLVAFAVYFGWWHALGSVLTQLEFLKTTVAAYLVSAADSSSSVDGVAVDIRPAAAGSAAESDRKRDYSGVPNSPLLLSPAGGGAASPAGSVGLADVKRFGMLAAPFSAVALAFIVAFFLWMMPPFNPTAALSAIQPHDTHIWTAFVVCISSLTAPHLWVMMLMHDSADAPTVAATPSSSSPSASSARSPVPPQQISDLGDLLASLLGENAAKPHAPPGDPRTPHPGASAAAATGGSAGDWVRRMQTRALDFVDAVLP